MRKRTPQRASDPPSAQEAHYTRLSDEFGMPRGGRYHSVDDGRPVSGRSFWLHPTSLFILSLLALVVVGTAQLWRWGAFDPLFSAASAKVDRSSKRWLEGGRSGQVAAEDITEVDEPDIDRGPPPEDEGEVVPVKD